MKKIVNPGTVNGKEIFVEIVFENGRLTLHGVIGPRNSGRCHSCGQIEDELLNVVPNADWTKEKCRSLFDVWERWHLNDLRAGSPVQEKFIREWKLTNEYSYDAVCEALKEAGIYEDESYIVDEKPYKYGFRWIKEEVPAGVIDWLFALPTAKKTPAWV